MGLSIGKKQHYHNVDRSIVKAKISLMNLPEACLRPRRPSALEPAPQTVRRPGRGLGDATGGPKLLVAQAEDVDRCWRGTRKKPKSTSARTRRKHRCAPAALTRGRRPSPVCDPGLEARDHGGAGFKPTKTSFPLSQSLSSLFSTFFSSTSRIVPEATSSIDILHGSAPFFESQPTRHRSFLHRRSRSQAAWFDQPPKQGPPCCEERLRSEFVSDRLRAHKVS